MPERLQLSRAKGWRISPNTLIVSRPNALGNPYRVYQHCKGPDGDWGVEDTGRLHESIGHGWTRSGAHQMAVDSYRKVLDEVYSPGSTARAILAMNLAAKDYLACWCGPDLPCHVDVLLDVATEWPPFPEPERTPA